MLKAIVNFKKYTIFIFISSFLCYSVSLADIKQENAYKTANFYQYLLAESSPQTSLLTLFFNKMPKGGDIHHHYAGAIYAETYLEWVAKKGWFIDKCTFRVVKVFDKQNKLCPVLTVAELINDDTSYRKLLLLWSSKDFYNHQHQTLPPDANFFNTFAYFIGISSEYIDLGVNIIKKRAKQENVAYIETMLERPGINNKDYFSESEARRYNKALSQATTQKATNKILNSIIRRLTSTENFNNTIDSFVSQVDKYHIDIDDDDFIMRYQTYAVRVLPPLQVFLDLFSGYLVVIKSPLFVGVNIVAPENNTLALEHYMLHMRMYNFLKAKYPNVNRALHAGELTLGMVRPEDLKFHIKQALDIAGAQRIGHGTDIVYEDDNLATLEKLKQNAAVEISLASSEFILGIKDNAHPYIIYAHYGVPIVIATDDSGVLRDNLSYQYVLLATRYKPSYATIKDYVYNSIKYSFLLTADKNIINKRLAKSFFVFEAEMANLYNIYN